MTLVNRLAIVTAALLTLFLGASPAVAATGASFGACVAHHATTDRGFAGGHNPGMHQGYAGWPGCPD